ncbi:MAG: hypothetical protein QM679_09710 [Patulibacter sp.]
MESRPVYEAHREVLRTLEAARDADPRHARFGVLIGDPWEDGAQQFFWYPTRAALEYALLDAHPFADPDAFAEDHEAWREPQFDLDAALRELPELAPEIAEELDDLVNEFYCIVWIGHLDDLIGGDDPLAGALREELRDGAGRADDASPLAEHELDEFIGLLRALGEPE